MESVNDIEKELQEKIDEMTPKGSLFEAINYYNDEQLDEFYKNMTREQAIYCLMEATKSAYRRGAYKLEECEAISKAFRVIGF
jgi:hypothetical protein